MSLRNTRSVKVGNLVVGGDSPISVQTMWKEPLRSLSGGEFDTTIKNIEKLVGLGCEILRFAVPDMESASVLGRIASAVKVAVVADIHYDYRIALECLDHSIAKLRINPGNIGARWKVEEVVRKAKEKDVPIRIGVNGGSLPHKLKKEKDTAIAMLHAASDELEILTRVGYEEVIVSLKSSDPDVTIRANTLFSENFAYPLHLGVTEAGPLIPGIVKNTYALTSLLRSGIGDTVRVSLTGAPEDEILTAYEILRISGRRFATPQIISCPRCGRHSFDVDGFYREVQNSLRALRRNITVAIMGCPVNGLDEARNADLGITGTSKGIIIFKKGKVVRRVSHTDALAAFQNELERI